MQQREKAICFCFLITELLVSLIYHKNWNSTAMLDPIGWEKSVILSLEVIGGRLGSILGLFSSFRSICRTGLMGLGWMGLGWLSLVVGSLRAPSVLITQQKLNWGSFWSCLGMLELCSSPPSSKFWWARFPQTPFIHTYVFGHGSWKRWSEFSLLRLPIIIDHQMICWSSYDDHWS